MPLQSFPTLIHKCVHLDLIEIELFTVSFTAKICGEDGQVDPNCFILAQSVVFSAMEQE